MLAHSTRVAKELGIAATNACAAAKSVCGHDRVWLVVRPRDRFVLVGAMGPVADIAARLFAGGSCIGSIGHFIALARGSASQPDCTSLEEMVLLSRLTGVKFWPRSRTSISVQPSR